jgi:DNA ligase (NAD+)
MEQNQEQIIQFSRLALHDKFKLDSAEKMHQLVEALRYHEWRYYIVNEPILSDTEYDLLFKLLERGEQEHPQWKDPASPTLRVSLDITDNFTTVDHLTPMLSLANSYDENDLREFDSQIKRVLKLEADQEITYSVEPKLDGGGISLVYENDRLVRAVTRGDGARGEDITANGMSLRSIPLNAAFSKLGIKIAEVRGEALIAKDAFQEMNQIRQANNLPLFANARNAATGGLRTKDPNETGARRIEAFVYFLSYAADEQGKDLLGKFDSHYESLEFLISLGFKVPTQIRTKLTGIANVIQFCAQWQKDRESYPYEIDGMVIKVDYRPWQIAAGFTAHHPRWAIAYKFQAKQAATRLIDVEYQVGKIGSITPVAKLEPVSLAGVTVSSVSLHNEEFIESRDLHIGDMVVVERAGDVIPYIVKAITDLRNGEEKKIIFPRNCPSCHSLLVKPEGEAIWRCVNPDCEAQQIQKLIFFVSKDAMDIDGFGKSIVEKFFELGWVRSFADIYKLDPDKIAQLEGFGATSASKLIQAIEASKSNPIHRLLHALSIHHVGAKVAKIISATVDSIFDLSQRTQEQLCDIPEIGPVVASNVVSYFTDAKNLAQLQEMESLGVNMQNNTTEKSAALDASHPLYGKTILFTGTLHQLTRDKAQEIAESFGAKNLSAVSKNLNILVVGENAGSKLTKAQQIGTIQIMNEEEFLELVTK